MRVGQYHQTRLIPNAPNGGDNNSYCLLCATWYFGRIVTKCEKCHHPIWWVYRTRDLVLMQRHGGPGATRVIT